MNWKAFADQLGSVFQTVGLEMASGRIYLPEQPFNLDEAAEEFATTEEDFCALEDGGARELESEEWSIQGLLGFIWDSFGPMSSAALIESLDTGGSKEFICVVTEMEPWRAIAALEPKSEKELYSASFGIAYKEVFGSLPSLTENYVPDLISSEVIKKTYWEWMEWADKADYASWADLRDGLLGTLREPNHLKRSLEILKNLSKELALESIEEYLAKRREQSAALSHTERRQILDLYFTVSYKELTTR